MSEPEEDTDPDRSSSTPPRRHRYSRTPKLKDALPATHGDVRAVSRNVVGYMMIAAIGLGGGAYMTLHDAKRDVVDVQADHDEDIQRVRLDVERRHDDHTAHGHPNITKTLHNIDIRLTSIESEIQQIRRDQE